MCATLETGPAVVHGQIEAVNLLLRARDVNLMPVDAACAVAIKTNPHDLTALPSPHPEDITGLTINRPSDISEPGLVVAHEPSTVSSNLVDNLHTPHDGFGEANIDSWYGSTSSRGDDIFEVGEKLGLSRM